MGKLLERLLRVEAELGLTDEAALADYLRVPVEAIRNFKAAPDERQLPAEGLRSLGVAWRYVVVSDAVLGLLPGRLRDSARRWEQARARVLARQRAGRS